MSTLGKVFLVIVLVESIAFSVFSMALFSKRITWRELYIDHIGKKNEEIAKDKSEIKTLDGKKVALEENNKTLTQEVDAARKKVLDKDAEIEKIKKESDAKIAEITALKAEVNTKEDENKQRLMKIADLEKEKGEIATRLATADADKKMYAEKMSEAVMEKEKYKTAARISEKRTQMIDTEIGILRQQVDYCTKNHKQFDVGVIKQVEKISGFVTAVYPDNQGLVMVDKGIKDGVTANMEFIVYRDIRGGVYIGKIRIIEVYDNMSAGVVITIVPDKKVQSGDEVTTKLE